MTPASAAPARRPTSSTLALWRACCGRASLTRSGCPMSAAGSCVVGSRAASWLMRTRTRAKNEIQAVLQRRLQERPPFADLFGVKGRQWLAGLELPVEERESVDAGLRQIAFMDTEIAAVDRSIAQQALAWPEIRRLMTVSGVNLICAASFYGRNRRGLPVLDQPQAGRLPRAGSQGPPVRRDTGALRPDLQARVGVRAVGAGRSGVERSQATRPAARVL